MYIFLDVTLACCVSSVTKGPAALDTAQSSQQKYWHHSPCRLRLESQILNYTQAMDTRQLQAVVGRDERYAAELFTKPASHCISLSANTYLQSSLYLILQLPLCTECAFADTVSSPSACVAFKLYLASPYTFSTLWCRTLISCKAKSCDTSTES